MISCAVALVSAASPGVRAPGRLIDQSAGEASSQVQEPCPPEDAAGDLRSGSCSPGQHGTLQLLNPIFACHGEAAVQEAPINTLLAQCAM